MVCAEYDSLRREWIAARADYQLALADLQLTSGVDDFRAALRRANETFSGYYSAESALEEHLRNHGCSRVPVTPLTARWLQSA